MATEVRRITVACTTWACPNGIGFQVPCEDTTTHEEVMLHVREMLKTYNWGGDRMGMLCPTHKPEAIGGSW